MPHGWEQALGVVAHTFHLRDVWDIEIDELLFWLDRANWIREQRDG